MSRKYSVILCTLATDGADVWETPRELLETVADLGYDGVDLDAEPDKIPMEKFNEVRDIAHSVGLQVPGLILAWAEWHAGEVRDLCSTNEAIRQRTVEYSKKCVDLSATFDDPPVLEIDAAPPLAENDYPQTKKPEPSLRNLAQRGSQVIYRLLFPA